MSYERTSSEKNFERKNVPIVCIGASAGGLEAIELFFQNCPSDLGAAYVVIQHLSSHYKSMMDDLVNRYSSMAVKMIESDEVPEANTIYLIQAGTTITLEKNRFKVQSKLDGELSLPIDIFLQSLADDKVPTTIAIILSGTGSDGSRGIHDIHAQAGFVIAQVPSEASFDGMPQSAISTGMVDNIVSAAEMGNIVARYLKSGDKPEQERFYASFVDEPEQHRNRILEKLLTELNISFGFYKEATVNRRIERRMQVKHIADLAKYAEVVEKDPNEVFALRKELLIPVSSFFRDPNTFQFIYDDVLQKIIETKKPGEEIRFWVAGCATGEEAYTYAILLDAKLRELNKRINFKLFATDVNPDIIEKASRGEFSENAKTEIPPTFLKTYFTASEKHITINQDIRQRVVFAVHNLLADAPFTKMDLVSCRNTLIYFTQEAQQEALQRMQFAVNQDGFLVLGKSESLMTQTDYFSQVHKSFKIYVCDEKSPAIANMLKYSSQGQNYKVKRLGKKSFAGKRDEIERIAESEIQSNLIPLCLLVNQHFEILHIYGQDTSLLSIRSGIVSNKVSSVLPDKLAPVAIALIQRLVAVGKPSQADPVLIDINGEVNEVKLKGWQSDTDTEHPYFILSFDTQRIESDAEYKSETIDVPVDLKHRIQQLEAELGATRESLQTTIEELETTNEELQATNEELMASNEEMQSSNEELQSVNEELNTVNAEYHEKMSILNRINADLGAMSLSTGIATIFVDDQQNLTRFTPDASFLFKVREQDLGRPLNEIVNLLEYPALFDDIQSTIESGITRENEVMGPDNRGYLMRIVSYKLPSVNKLGAAISLIESESFGSYHKIIDALPEHIAVLDSKGEIVLVNKAWKRFALVNSDQQVNVIAFLGSNYLDVCAGDPESIEIGEGIRMVLSGKKRFYSHKYPCHSPTEKRWFIMEVRFVEHSLYRAVISHINVSQWEKEDSEA